MKNYFATLMALLLTVSGYSQEIGFTLFGTHTNPYSGPYSLITLDSLQGAKTLQDLYVHYRPSQVASYISVEISSACQGQINKAASTDDALSPAQMDILKRADKGCIIDVVVDYIPNNTLKDNPPRKMSFSLTMVPIIEAKYPGGSQQLKAYLKEQIMDQVSASTAAQIPLATVRFTINREGKLTDAHLFKTSGVETIDTLILEAICNMPKWSPAKNASGKIISQDFEFRMGTDLLRCDYRY